MGKVMDRSEGETAKEAPANVVAEALSYGALHQITLTPEQEAELCALKANAKPTEALRRAGVRPRRFQFVPR